MIKNWKTYKLIELCELVIGKTPRRDTPEYWGEGVMWVSISDIKDKFISSSKEDITQKAIEESKCKLVKKGTLLMSFKLSIGKLTFAGKDLYTNEAIVALPTINPKIIYPEFLYYALKYIPLVGSNQAAKGKTLNKKSLAELKIPTPESLTHQIQIATLLSQVEALIQKRKESIAWLDELVKSMFLEMFGDPRINDKNWELKNLGEVSDLARGRFSPRPRNDPSYYGGKFPFIQTGDISKSNFRLNSYTQTLNIKGTKVSKKFPKGTIVIAIVGATIGMTAILELDVFATDSIIGISVKEEKINNYFLEYVLRLLRPSIIKSAPEAARANINLRILDKLKIIVPSNKQQEKFAKTAKKIEFIKTKYDASLIELENLYGSLSQKAFRGELDLSKMKVEIPKVITTERKEAEISRTKENKAIIPPPPLGKNISKKKKRDTADSSNTRFTSPKEARKLHLSPLKKWLPASIQQIADLIKEKYQGLYFNIEMFIRLLRSDEITFLSYFSSNEIKKDPSLDLSTDLKEFIFSSLSQENPFLKLEQVFYDAEEENFTLEITEEDYELIKDRSKKEQSSIYFRIIE